MTTWTDYDTDMTNLVRRAIAARQDLFLRHTSIEAPVLLAPLALMINPHRQISVLGWRYVAQGAESYPGRILHYLFHRLEWAEVVPLAQTTDGVEIFHATRGLHAAFGLDLKAWENLEYCNETPGPSPYPHGYQKVMRNRYNEEGARVEEVRIGSEPVFVDVPVDLKIMPGAEEAVKEFISKGRSAPVSIHVQSGSAEFLRPKPEPKPKLMVDVDDEV